MLRLLSLFILECAFTVASGVYPVSLWNYKSNESNNYSVYANFKSHCNHPTFQIKADESYYIYGSAPGDIALPLLTNECSFAITSEDAFKLEVKMIYEIHSIAKFNKSCNQFPSYHLGIYDDMEILNSEVPDQLNNQTSFNITLDKNKSLIHASYIVVIKMKQSGCGDPCFFNFTISVRQVEPANGQYSFIESMTSIIVSSVMAVLFCVVGCKMLPSRLFSNCHSATRSICHTLISYVCWPCISIRKIKCKFPGKCCYHRDEDTHQRREGSPSSQIDMEAITDTGIIPHQPNDTPSSLTTIQNPNYLPSYSDSRNYRKDIEPFGHVNGNHNRESWNHHTDLPSYREVLETVVIEDDSRV